MLKEGQIICKECGKLAKTRILRKNSKPRKPSLFCNRKCFFDYRIKHFSLSKESRKKISNTLISRKNPAHSLFMKGRFIGEKNGRWIKDRSKLKHTKENQAIYQKERRKITNKYIRNRKKNDPCYKLERALRSRLHNAIKQNNKAGSTVRDLGCSIKQFKEYIEKQFTEGMSWNNHGKYGWHLDHIVPLCNFDLTNREQFLKASNYTNLQPLWWVDNLCKEKDILKINKK